MSDQDELDKLLQSFSSGLKMDVTPPAVVEMVVILFDDGEYDIIPADELERG